MMGKNKERFRRLAQPSDKAAHSQNVSALNGQLTDVASEIYKIYVQDSQAAHNRLEMHKTLSLLKIQQVSRTSQKEKDAKFPTSSLSPSKCQKSSQNPQASNHNSSMRSQISITQQHQKHIANRKQQNQMNLTPKQSVQVTPQTSNNCYDGIQEYARQQRTQTTAKSSSIQSAFAGVTSTTTAQSNYPVMNSAKLNAIDSYSACYGVNSGGSSSQKQSHAPQRQSKKKKAHRLVPHQTHSFDLTKEPPMSPTSRKEHDANLPSNPDFAIKRESKFPNDKSIDLNKKPSMGQSPCNGNNSKPHKHRVTSGVNKIKLIADQTIKQAVNEAALRNETPSRATRKSVTLPKFVEVQQIMIGQEEPHLEERHQLVVNQQITAHPASSKLQKQISLSSHGVSSSHPNIGQECHESVEGRTGFHLGPTTQRGEKDSRDDAGLPVESKGQIFQCLNSDQLIVASGYRGTSSSQGRISRAQASSQNSQPVPKKVIYNYKKTIREKMLLQSDAKYLFDTSATRVLNTDITKSVVSPTRTYYRQPVILTKKSLKRSSLSGNKALVPKKLKSNNLSHLPLTVRTTGLIGYLKQLLSKDKEKISLEKLCAKMDSFQIQKDSLFGSKFRPELGGFGSGVELSRLISYLQDYLVQVAQTQQTFEMSFYGSRQKASDSKRNSLSAIKGKTFSIESTGIPDLNPNPLTIQSEASLTTTNCEEVTPNSLIIASGIRLRTENRESQTPFESNRTGATKPDSTVQLQSKRVPLIKVLIQEEKIHTYHPVNKCIRLINQFAIEAFIKQSQTYMMPPKPKMNKKQQGTNKFQSQNYQTFAATAASPANNSSANVDMAVVTSLAKQLQITLPKNNDMRSKAFICHAKEQMLVKLYEALNKSNLVELHFKRQNFQLYRGFIGRGNNASLLFQLFKQSRWWWNLYSAPVYDENGKVLMQHGQTSAQLLREDFKEHNFIFTQWKKMLHYNVLKNIQVKEPAQSESINQGTTSTISPNAAQALRKDAESSNETNLSNQWRIYAKIEGNYHLSNKFALFFHISKYYRSIERDPFDVLPLTFHIKKGTTDPVYFKFVQVFKQIEEDHQKQLETNFSEPVTVQICIRCAKISNRSGLGRREANGNGNSQIISQTKLSLPEFVNKSETKIRRQNTVIEGSEEQGTPTQAAHILQQNREVISNQAQKMSTAEKASKITNGKPESCYQCGLMIEQIQNQVLQNAQSVSSIKRRTSFVKENEDADNPSFKVSKGRFSAKKLDKDKQYVLSQRNHSTNKREAPAKTQASLTRLHRGGQKLDEVSGMKTLTVEGEGEFKISTMKTEQGNMNGPFQQTRLPAIRTNKQPVANAIINRPNLKEKITQAIEDSRKKQINCPININDKLQSQISKTCKNRSDTYDKNGKIQPQPKVIPNNIWIVKPGENSNRGNGISVCSSLKEIKEILCQSDYNKQKTFIVQKYLERPALYNQRKFDIRCFAMLTLVNNYLKGFTYDNGYLRTSSRTFVAGDLTNKLIHLTNDAVQKKADDYGRYETGNKLSFSEYQSYLDLNFPHLKIDFRSHIFSQIKQIMTDTFRATYKVVAPTRTLPHHSFEIFGFDFMLDEQFKVHLIEVNTNPCLETTCPILQKIITDMVDSGIRIALDPLYPPPNHQKRMNTTISLVQWQLCFDELIDAGPIEALQDQVQNARNDAAGDADEGLVEEDLIKECEDEDVFD